MGRGETFRNRKLYEVGNWDGVVRAVAQSPEASADLLLYRGLALAHLQSWEEAKAAFAAGRAKSPGDPRFLIELAVNCVPGEAIFCGQARFAASFGDESER